MSDLLKFNDLAISGSYAPVVTDGVTLSGDGSSAYPIGVVANRYEAWLFTGGLHGTATFTAAPLSQPASAFDMLAVCVCNNANAQAECNEINYIVSTDQNPADGRACFSHIHTNLGAGGNEYWLSVYTYYDSANNTIRAIQKTPGSYKRAYAEVSANYTNTAITATSAVHNNKCIKWVKGIKYLCNN